MKDIKIESMYLYSYDECKEIKKWYDEAYACYLKNSQMYEEELKHAQENGMSVSLMRRMGRAARRYTKDNYEYRQKNYLRDSYSKMLAYKKYLAEQKGA